MKQLSIAVYLLYTISSSSLLSNNFNLDTDIVLSQSTQDIGVNCNGNQTKSASTWEIIFEQQKNKVVQIFSHTVNFDWDKPFRRGETRHGLGSGFVISPDGEIYTNFHVVDASEVLFIQLPATGKERFEVEFLGGSPEYDCSRLKIKSAEFERLKTMMNVQSLEYVTLGDSDTLKENQKIMLIGYPLGQENVKSALGCVSGREEAPMKQGSGEWITTTTPGNPGNSGGPYFGKDGSVIGIHVAGIQTAKGIAYLIPINSVKKIMPECVDGKVVRAPYWGIDARPTTQATLSYMGLTGSNGMIVITVGKQSLAERAGLQAGDVIVGINNYDVDRFGYLSVPWAGTRVEWCDVLARFGNNETVTFSVFRSGVIIECSVQLTFEMPFAVQECYPTLQEKPDYEVFGGLVLMELTRNHLERLTPYLHMAVEKGVFHPLLKYFSNDALLTPRLYISDILPETDLFKSSALVSRDLIITSVNGVFVTTLEEFRAAMLQYDKKTLFCNITTESGVTFALWLPDVVTQDPLLAQRYGYKSSSLMSSLLHEWEPLYTKNKA